MTTYKTYLNKLAASIDELGLLQCPTVQYTGRRYRYINGSRRVAACKKLGWKTMKVLVSPYVKVGKRILQSGAKVDDMFQVVPCLLTQQKVTITLVSAHYRDVDINLLVGPKLKIRGD